jgi:hypothetical protein
VRFHPAAATRWAASAASIPKTAEDIVQFSLGARRSLTLQPSLRMNPLRPRDVSIQRVDVCDLLGLFQHPRPAAKRRLERREHLCFAGVADRSIHTEDAADLGLDSANLFHAENPAATLPRSFSLRDYREGDPRHSGALEASAAALAASSCGTSACR